ncbi:senecionine N-oxygenase-like isoform X2 [Onthophagus taurus]|uniref:senecionine N-oxygenase-like isoform X2 n=1 Tax=Onthophagus taurus TaxID=166361 RepID=UPI000C2097F2|nr:senecionine N-oxygenase-like [Onthophagus taurus]
MKVAVIGAGPSGLASARYARANGFDCTVFEQTGRVGGVWNYNERVGVDEEGVRLHSVMYKDLVTNQPKEIMSYPGYPYPKQIQSYLPQPKVTEYIKGFVQQFNILPSVKFYKRVVLVEPIENNRWKLTVEDIKSKVQEILEFDAVMVCVGSNFKIFMPDIVGIDTFTGNIIHSNIYRTPDEYKGQNVLVIGAGSSGTDIAAKIAAVANKVVLSHKFNMPIKTSSQVIQKNVVKRFVGKNAVFIDDSVEEFDAIVCATGYQLIFPFLSEKCDIVVKNRWIQYLYKHIINISHPTMGFIGFTSLVTHFPVYDLQARFYISYLLNNFTIPSKDEMKQDILNEMDRKVKSGGRPSEIHKLGGGQEAYCEDIATMAKVEPLPKAIHKLFARVRADRNIADCFEFVDNENFIQLNC